MSVKSEAEPKATIDVATHHTPSHSSMLLDDGTDQLSVKKAWGCLCGRTSKAFVIVTSIMGIVILSLIVALVCKWAHAGLYYGLLSNCCVSLPLCLCFLLRIIKYTPTPTRIAMSTHRITVILLWKNIWIPHAIIQLISFWLSTVNKLFCLR